MQVRIVLEWFLNPDHLPFLYGIETGLFEKAGFDVSLVEPDEHYDGFEDIKSGKAEMAITEPLHLVERYQESLLSLGCFFETKGGILLKESARQKMQHNEILRITTPASNTFTNALAQQIIQAYCKDQGLTMPAVSIKQTDFMHLKHLQEGYDAAWLCFENFEGVESRFENVDAQMIDVEALGLPNVSALELITSQELFDANRDAYLQFVNVINRCTQALVKDTERAKTIYYAKAGGESRLMDAIIEDTLTRFHAIELGAEKWRGLYSWIKELGLSDMDIRQYESMFEYSQEPALS